MISQITFYKCIDRNENYKRFLCAVKLFHEDRSLEITLQREN